MSRFTIFQDRLESVVAWRTVQVVSWIVVVLGVVVAANRAVRHYHPPGPFHPQRTGFIEFHNGIYLPAQAFAAGVSPYSAEYAETYPVARPTPAYSPLNFAYHVPLTWLPLPVAEWFYFTLMAALAIGFVGLLLQDAGLPRGIWLGPLLAFLVWSRAGHATLLGGYFTFELVLGTVAALHFARTKPWIAAIGMAVASVKPNYFIPLAILMLARGDFRAAIRGTLLSVVGAIASAAWLMRQTGVASFFQDIQASQAIHRHDNYETPINTWTRIDLAAVIGKWTEWNPSGSTLLVLMLLLLAVPVGLLWRNRKEPTGATHPTGSLICVASLVAIYHQMYDALLIFPALVGLLLSRQSAWGRVSPLVRWGAAGCLLVPLYNITSTRFFLQRSQPGDLDFQLLTSTNGVAMLLGLILLTIAAYQAGTIQSAGGPASAGRCGKDSSLERYRSRKPKPKNHESTQ